LAAGHSENAWRSHDFSLALRAGDIDSNFKNTPHASVAEGGIKDDEKGKPDGTWAANDVKKTEG
jgi:hypothetical protein